MVIKDDIFLFYFFLFLGESPPGLAAQLGMGFGITIISVLVIGEVIFLYRKYGPTGSTRQRQYELPGYHNRLSI
jgi:hypothetical protein